MIIGIPQRLMLGPLLSVIYIVMNDLEMDMVGTISLWMTQRLAELLIELKVVLGCIEIAKV